MISRRGFIAGLLALPVVAKLAPAISPVLPGAQKRRLKAIWSFECAEDLRNMHGMGATADEFREAGFVHQAYIPMSISKTYG